MNDHHRQLISFLGLNPRFLTKEAKHVTIIGGGLGVLAKFLYNHFDAIEIENIEQEASINAVAK